METGKSLVSGFLARKSENRASASDSETQNAWFANCIVRILIPIDSLANLSLMKKWLSVRTKSEGRGRRARRRRMPAMLVNYPQDLFFAHCIVSISEPGINMNVIRSRMRGSASSPSIFLNKVSDPRVSCGDRMGFNNNGMRSRAISVMLRHLLVVWPENRPPNISRNHLLLHSRPEESACRRLRDCHSSPYPCPAGTA